MQVLLVSYMGALGTVVSSPVLVLCTHSAALYDELYRDDELLTAAEILAAVAPGSQSFELRSKSQLALHQRYQVEN